jgi:myosin heavy subunit
MESLSNEMKDLGETSTSPIVKAVYDCSTGASTGVPPTSGATRRSSIRGVSIATQFKMSLQSLVDDLEQTQPHYIRCIKPNLKKTPNALGAGEVLKQLRYSGMMEAIRIRREGYALREDHMGFYNRFSVLLTQADKGDGGIAHLVQVLSKRLGVSDADWQIGHSKIFMRRELSEKLERLAKLRVHAAARTLGRFGKSVVFTRVTSFLVAWARFRLVMLKKYRRMRAASKIGSAYRTHVQIQRYIVARKAVIKIQSRIRHRSAVQRVRKIRDPYCDMTFKELKRLLRSETSQLEKAATDKDFKTAAQLEAKM